MRRRSFLISSLFMSSICLGFISCASIISGTRADIILNGSIDEPVDIQTDHKYYTRQVLPTTVQVKRGKKVSRIEMSSSNYEYEDVWVTKKTNPWFAGNILLGGLPGMIVDLSTGSAWKPAEESFYVNATKKINSQTESASSRSMIIGTSSNGTMNIQDDDTDGELLMAEKVTMPKETASRPVVKKTKAMPVNVDVDMNIPSTSKDNENMFVVVIANENYSSEAKVHYAINDGRIFKEYCTNTLGVPETNIHIIEDATLNNIRREITWLKRVASVYEGDARIIVYYAGHGIPDEATGSAYLLPIDGVGTDVQTGYSLKTFYAELGKMPSQCVTVFMDACFSGSQRGEGMLASSRGVAIKAKEETPMGNLVVFSATQGDETAFPYDEKGHGLFTYFLLKKLQETRGEVSYEELGTYLKKQVSRHAIVVNNKPQTPSMSSSAALTGKLNNMKLK